MKLQMCVCWLSSKYLKSQEFIVYVQIQKCWDENQEIA